VSRTWQRAAPPRVGLFGLFGSSNIGNDGSLDVVLTHLRDRHPDAVLNCLCSGPASVAARYGIATAPLYWHLVRERSASRLGRMGVKLVGKLLDSVRILRWVRRQDVVIVPGTGALETTLPLRPWGFPLSLFLLCLFGRLTGTKVALLNVGVSVIRQRTIRWLCRSAARLAHYRSYRDPLSRQSMREMGVDTSADDVYPDLAFALPVPTASPARGTVGVGVMDFHGSNDDRRRADQIHDSYVDAVKRFVRWLLDEGRRVRLFTGDAVDQKVVLEILDDVRAYRPGLDPSTVVAEPLSTLGDLMRQVTEVDVMVGTRYHNVVSGLKLAKPTISLSYAEKNDRVMADMGLAGYCQDARTVDVGLLIAQFTALEQRASRLRPLLVKRAAAKAAALAAQFELLSVTLLSGGERVPEVTPTVPGSP
jgi:polysaccharide pyruvyl transferase WcaK-like protein